MCKSVLQATLYRCKQLLFVLVVCLPCAAQKDDHLCSCKSVAEGVLGSGLGSKVLAWATAACRNCWFVERAAKVLAGVLAGAEL
jgi:hypothetical protein